MPGGLVSSLGGPLRLRSRSEVALRRRACRSPLRGCQVQGGVLVRLLRAEFHGVWTVVLGRRPRTALAEKANDSANDRRASCDASLSFLGESCRDQQVHADKTRRKTQRQGHKTTQRSKANSSRTQKSETLGHDVNRAMTT